VFGQFVSKFIKNRIYSISYYHYNGYLKLADGSAAGLVVEENVFGSIEATATNSINNFVNSLVTKSFKKNIFNRVRYTMPALNWHFININCAESVVSENIIGSVIVNDEGLVNGTSSSYTPAIIVVSGTDAVIEKNTIHYASFYVGRPIPTSAKSYRIDGIRSNTSGQKVIGNFINQLTLNATLGQYVAGSITFPGDPFPFSGGETPSSTVSFIAAGITISTSATEVKDNTVGVYSPAYAIGILNLAPATGTPPTTNEGNSVYAESYSLNAPALTTPISIAASNSAVGFLGIKNLKKSRLRPGHYAKVLYDSACSFVEEGDNEESDVIATIA
jgi:hypothetical protein